MSNVSASPSSPSTTEINEVIYNQNTLTQWKYIYYSGNHTLSNDTSCWLIYDQYKPVVFENGTLSNAVSCYDPVRRIQLRGALSLVFGVLFAFSIIATCVNLSKHGRSWFSQSRRRTAFRRRWQWIWMVLLAFCGLASAFTGVDVDRYHVLGMPIVLQSLFFTLMRPFLVLIVWEAVKNCTERHKKLRADEALPFDHGDVPPPMYLAVYGMTLAGLLLDMIRSWPDVQFQRSPEQTQRIGRSVAMNNLSIASSVLYLATFVLIQTMLGTNLRVLRQRSTWLIVGAESAALAEIIYTLVACWAWNISYFNASANVAWTYVLGYGTVLLAIVLWNMHGFLTDNIEKAFLAKTARSRDGSTHKSKSDPRQRLLNATPRRRVGPLNSSSAGTSTTIYSDYTSQNVYQLKELPPRQQENLHDDDQNGSSWWWSKKTDAAQRDDAKNPESGVKRQRWTSDADVEQTLKGDMTIARRKRWNERKSSPAGSVESAMSIQKPAQTVRSMLDG